MLGGHIERRKGNDLIHHIHVHVQVHVDNYKHGIAELSVCVWERSERERRREGEREGEKEREREGEKEREREREYLLYDVEEIV